MANDASERGSQVKFLLPSKLSGSQHGFPGWRPFYLRRWVLGLFVLVFCAIIAALEVLNEASKKNDGLAPSVRSLRYTWTYGPTAILTLVAVFWGRVEFQAKHTAPWRRMCEGPEIAEKSVLVDYISPLQPFSMFRAIKSQDYLPAAAVACSMLLRLLVVFTTGLFTLQEIPVVSQDVPVQLLDSLDSNRFQYDKKSWEPYDTINAVLFQDLTWPDGTNKNLVFQSFSAPGLSSDAIVNVTVDGLTADLECESASIAVKNWEVVTLHMAGTEWNETVYKDIKISTPSCDISKADLDRDYPMNRDFIYRYQQVKCDRSSGLDGYRFLVTAVKIHWSDTSSPYDISFDNPGPVKKSWKTKQKLSVDRSAQLICKPTLSRVKLQVAVNVSEPLSSARIQKIGSPKPLSASMNWKLANATSDLRHLPDSSRPLFYMKPWNEENTTSDNSLKLGAYLTEPPTTGDINKFLDADVLSDTIRSYYRTVTAQVMHTSMVVPKRSTTMGKKIINEKRVVISPLSLRVIEAGLALGVLLAVAMIALLSRKATAGIPLAPWDPNKISAIAAMLPTSNEFCSILRIAGALPSKSSDEYLKSHRYHTGSSQKGFSIAITESYYDPNHDRYPAEQKPEKPWKPLPNCWLRFPLLFLVALVIAALEVVLRLSRASDGLVTVSLDDYTHYFWTLIPSLVMVSIGLFFGSLDFNIRCLAPYARLKRPQGASFDESLSVSFLDALALTIAFRALRAKNMAVLATTITTMISAFLATATSGLYYAVEVPMHKPVNFTQTSVFYNASLEALWTKIGRMGDRDSHGMVTANYILRDNVSFPRWTYDTLALPKLAIDPNQNSVSFADIKVPALRSALTCRLQSGAALNPNYTDSPLQLFVDILGNIACPVKNKSSTINEPIPGGDTMDLKSHAYFGKTVQNVCGGYQRYNFPHSTSYIWGYLNKPTDKKPITNVNALTCTDTAEFVETTAHFKLPSMDIVESHPPVPDESTAKKNSSIHIPFMYTGAVLSNGNEDPLDYFFQALVTGRYAIPVEDLGNAKANDKVVKAIKHQHQLIRAQQFSDSVRLNANGSLDHEPILGNATVLTRLRLVQDPTSTRFLEGLLGAMLLFGLIGTLLLNTDGVLPKNPCSIAAVASLLAHSNFLHHFDGDTVNADGSSREKGVFSRCRFFLGHLQGETVGGSAANLTIYMGDPVEGSNERLI
ncbi:hypothetical protein N7492_000184 [Penicillium capsulatum]|uniref:Uncharacterized protein n=1 Tax=Penicillium capsulatum TaxID=69766 RepID=A0A9W9IQS5_9EURO|nr:hypothetical protein N7492_000184 [Penicillium capsulatum]KAJ6130751.1 hypothetical protein N7512_003531 [Penicillium capsulatum]